MGNYLIYLLNLPPNSQNILLRIFNPNFNVYNRQADPYRPTQLSLQNQPSTKPSDQNNFEKLCEDESIHSQSDEEQIQAQNAQIEERDQVIQRFKNVFPRWEYLSWQKKTQIQKDIRSWHCFCLLVKYLQLRKKEDNITVSFKRNLILDVEQIYSHLKQLGHQKSSKKTNNLVQIQRNISEQNQSKIQVHQFSKEQNSLKPFENVFFEQLNDYFGLEVN